jgi:hypothetical protein
VAGGVGGGGDTFTATVKFAPPENLNANDIWIMNATDGTNLVNLTNSAAVDTFPLFITP